MGSADEDAARVALVTGSSRGIGAETARRLTADGTAVVINYRSKATRAQAVVDEIESSGGEAIAIGADLTDGVAVTAMAAGIRDRFGRLDLLVLNASGGLERDVDAGYALRLNRDAQLAVLDAVQPLMPAGSRVVYVTSHEAHFVGSRAGLDVYDPVARSKRAGEDALRARIEALAGVGIDLVVVSGDMIDGTVTATLLNRAVPGLIEERRTRAGGQLPDIGEFAAAVVAAATAEVPSGHTVFVGGSDYIDADVC